jgi:hypothetical protein
MIFRHNSTIGIKTKKCKLCGKDKIIFSKGRCKECATIEDTHSKISAAASHEEGFTELRDKLDDLISIWVRYSAVNEWGMVNCYTCDKPNKPADIDAGHYITRECMYLRFDLRNIRGQCRLCNRSKGGMAAEFGKRLELEHPGITEILLEESQIIHKWSREELRSMIFDFTQKTKTLKQEDKWRDRI